MPENQKPKGFWTKAKVALAIVLIAGIAIGAVLGHYAIEPFLNSQLSKSLSECNVQKNLLEGQASSLASELNECRNR